MTGIFPLPPAKQFDEAVGGYYLRARYYDPGAGRFVSSDPYAGQMNEPVTLHKYLYANANPVMYSDPSGLYSLNEVGAIQAIEEILITTHRYMSFVDTIDKVEGVVSFIGGIRKLISAAPQILNSHQSLTVGLGSFVSSGRNDKASRGVLNYQFWDEATTDFLGNIRQVVTQAIKAGWPKRVVSTMKGKNPAFLIYTPTPSKGFGMRTSSPIPTGMTIPFGKKMKIPVMLILGGHGSHGGRLTGLGLTGNTKRKDYNQIFRMDWHNTEGHSRPKNDYDYWKSGQFHYHIKKAKI